jgi:malonyl-CoA O-methyltransferase
MAEPTHLPATDRWALARQLRRLAQGPGAPWLHQEIARRMADRLPVIRQAPAAWLQWWGYLGGGRVEVAAIWPQARCTVVEPTPALAERSRQALRGPWWALGRAQAPVLLADELPAGQAPMLWANMVLHTSPQPDALLARWHGLLAVDGFLMFSTLGPDSLRELRALFADEGWPAPHPPYADMHDIGDQLVHAGFADPVMDQETVRLTWSSPEALLAELRGLGGHLGVARFAGLRTPRWRAHLLAALARRADAQGRIALSFEIVYGHAYKAAPRPPRGETTVVSLDSLRKSLSTGPRGQPSGRDPMLR